MKIAIITSGFLPVPASKGGAVESLLDNIIIKNEEYKGIKLEVFSIYDEKALELSKSYTSTNFNFIKTNSIVNIIDKFIYFIFKEVLKKDHVMSYRYIVQRLYFLNKVSKELKKNNYDKVFIENHPTLFLALKWRKNNLKYKNRYYYHLHNESSKFYGCAKIIKESKNILCVSNFIKNRLLEELNLPDDRNLSVLKNCIDINKFSGTINEIEKIELRSKYSISKNDRVIIFAGRLTREKGIKELLLALNSIEDNNLKLIIVGSFFFDTNIKNEFMEEIGELINKLGDRVVFTGYINYADMPKIYSIADIAVLPSVDVDAAPLTIIEAMASRLPIITTNSGGIPEYAQNGCAIIHQIDKNLISNLSKSIVKLLNDKEMRENMSKIGRENAEKLTLDEFYKNFLREIS